MIILRYGIEDDINVDNEMFREIVSEFMREIDLPEDLIGYYLSMFPKFEISAYYHKKHIDEIIEWLLRSKDHLLDDFDNNGFIQRDAMKILNNSTIGKWFGDIMIDTPRNTMDKLLENEFGLIRDYYASNK